MTDATRDFYDDLAAGYHRMFEDWDASIARQAAALTALLERECDAPARQIKVLDCACGIGTQILGLATHGFVTTGSDLSPVPWTASNFLYRKWPSPHCVPTLGLTRRMLL